MALFKSLFKYINFIKTFLVNWRNLDRGWIIDGIKEVINVILVQCDNGRVVILKQRSLLVRDAK